MSRSYTSVIVLNLPKAFIVVLSALVGASMILTGALLAFGRVSLTDLNWGLVGAFIRDSWFWSLAYLSIAAVGIAAQMLLPQGYTWEPYSEEQMTSRTPGAQAPASPSGRMGSAV